MRSSNSNMASVAPLTLIFLAANIILYFVSAAQSNNIMNMDITVLSNLGASQRERIWDNQWLHMVAPMFLHGGLLHIIMNMNFLWQAGPDTEVYFGSSNYGTIYLLSGVCGICLSQIFGGNISIGASTSLCGIMGAHLAITILNVPVLKYFYRSNQVRAVAFQLGFLLLLGILGFFNMDNWGHFGGMVGGLALGWGFELARRRSKFGIPVLLTSLAFVAVLILAARFTVFNPNYHIFVGVRAAEELKDERAAEASFDEARSWGKTLAPLHFLGVLDEVEVDNIIDAYKRGKWDLSSARKPGIGMLRVSKFYKRGRSDRNPLPNTD